MVTVYLCAPPLRAVSKGFSVGDLSFFNLHNGSISKEEGRCGLNVSAAFRPFPGQDAADVAVWGFNRAIRVSPCLPNTQLL